MLKKNLVLVLTNKRGKENFTFPIFDNTFLFSSKPLKIGPKYCIIPTKQIKRIKYWHMRQLQTETGESLAKF